MLSHKEYDNALAVEIVIKGFVSTKEFEDTAKKLEAFIARHGKVNVLEVIEDFEGMDGAAFWEDFKFTLRHLNDFSRCVTVGCRSLAMGLDPGDDFWPDVCACLAPDQYSEMLQPNPNLAWILNDAHTRCWHRVDTRFD
jgi:stage II sporulation SpoAA-like protein